MRSLPVMLSIALACTALTACDKKADEKKAEDKQEEKAGEKADAKKADEVSANTNTADPEAGCIHEHKHAEGESCEGHAPMPTEPTGHFGAAFALADTQPLSTVLASGTVPSEAVKVSGTVEAVCQKKGCWMVIKDGDAQARVLIKDHAFALPMDGKGKSATVEGTLESKELSEANVAHLKSDGDDTLTGDGPRKEYFLHATAVELVANS